MPSFNSAWGLWHWQNAVFKYTSGEAQLGFLFPHGKNNLLWLSARKVKQRSCPNLLHKKVCKILVVTPKLEYLCKWRHRSQAEKQKKPFWQTAQRFLVPSVTLTLTRLFFYANPPLSLISMEWHVSSCRWLHQICFCCCVIWGWQARLISHAPELTSACVRSTVSTGDRRTKRPKFHVCDADLIGARGWFLCWKN